MPNNLRVLSYIYKLQLTLTYKFDVYFFYCVVKPRENFIKDRKHQKVRNPITQEDDKKE